MRKPDLMIRSAASAAALALMLGGGAVRSSPAAADGGAWRGCDIALVEDYYLQQGVTISGISGSGSYVNDAYWDELHEGLILALGSAPDASCQLTIVPNVVDKTVEQARTKAEFLGLRLATTGAPTDVVVSQSFDPGLVIPIGYELSVETVPNPTTTDPGGPGGDVNNTSDPTGGGHTGATQPIDTRPTTPTTSPSTTSTTTIPGAGVVDVPTTRERPTTSERQPHSGAVADQGPRVIDQKRISTRSAIPWIGVVALALGVALAARAVVRARHPHRHMTPRLRISKHIDRLVIDEPGSGMPLAILVSVDPPATVLNESDLI